MNAIPDVLLCSGAALVLIVAAVIAAGLEGMSESRDVDTEDAVSLHERAQNLTDIYVKSRAEVRAGREYRETAIGWKPGPDYTELPQPTDSGEREWVRVTKEKGKRR